jgi:hypothetical protein
MHRPEFSQTDDEFEKLLLEAMMTPITDDPPSGCFYVRDDLPPYDQPTQEPPSDNDQD